MNNKVVIIIEPKNQFESKNSQKKNKAGYELKISVFGSNQYSKIKREYTVSDDDAKARKEYEALKRKAINQNMYKGVHINTPKVSLFKNGKVCSCNL